MSVKKLTACLQFQGYKSILSWLINHIPHFPNKYYSRLKILQMVEAPGQQTAHRLNLIINIHTYLLL